MLLAGADLPERAPAHAAGDRFDYGRACLALAGYAEARGEGDAGMATVMAVVLERTTDPRWPDTVCDVVEQPGQFEALARWQPPRHPERDEPEAWTRAQRLAEQLLADDRTLVPAACAGATSFQRGPAASGLVPACIVGRHSFFREPNRREASQRAGSEHVPATVPSPQALTPARTALRPAGFPQRRQNLGAAPSPITAATFQTTKPRE